MAAPIRFRENQTVVIPFTITDEDGAPVPKSAMDSIVGTIYVQATGDAVNGRDHVSILDDNGGTYHATAGTGEWLLTPSDMEVVDANAKDGQDEIHVVLVEYTYAGGTKSGSEELHLAVRKVQKRVWPTV